MKVAGEARDFDLYQMFQLEGFFSLLTLQNKTNVSSKFTENHQDLLITKPCHLYPVKQKM